MKGRQREGKDYAIVGGLSFDELGEPSISLYKEGWIVRAKLHVQTSGPVIGELIISPETPGKVVPQGGLTKVFLNSIPLSAIQSHIRKLEASLGLIDQLQRDQEPALYDEVFSRIKKLFPESATGAAPRKRGRPGRPLLFYAKVAQDYDAASRTGDLNPTVAVARKRRGMTRDQARDAVARARREGLLSKTNPGRPYGRVTPKALAILKQGTTTKGKRNK
jgi:hypothetical protein